MYAPNIKRPREHFFATLQEQIAEKSNGVKILGGDFIEVLATTDRVTQSKYKRNKTLHCLVDLMKHLNLTDIWKLKNLEKNVNLPGVGKIVLKTVELIFG